MRIYPSPILFTCAVVLGLMIVVTDAGSKSLSESFPDTPISNSSLRAGQMNIPCVVSLKKGRKLVIRTADGRRLPSTLPNRTKVTAVEMADGEGPGAAQIAVNRKGKQVILGWVSQADLKCTFK